MTSPSYVLDESIAYGAATGQNERGEEDPSSLQLFQKLYHQCHGLVFNSELWGRWQSTLSNLAGSGTSILPKMVFSYLSLFATTQDKFRLVEDAAAFDDENLVPEDDIYWIRLAVHTGSIAVTTDNRLMERLNQAGIPGIHSLTLLRPEDALERLPLELQQ